MPDGQHRGALGSASGILNNTHCLNEKALWYIIKSINRSTLLCFCFGHWIASRLTKAITDLDAPIGNDHTKLHLGETG